MSSSTPVSAANAGQLNQWGLPVRWDWICCDEDHGSCSTSTPQQAHHPIIGPPNPDPTSSSEPAMACSDESCQLPVVCCTDPDCSPPPGEAGLPADTAHAQACCGECKHADPSGMGMATGDLLTPPSLCDGSCLSHSADTSAQKAEGPATGGQGMPPPGQEDMHLPVCNEEDCTGGAEFECTDEDCRMLEAYLACCGPALSSTGPCETHSSQTLLYQPPQPPVQPISPYQNPSALDQSHFSVIQALHNHHHTSHTPSQPHSHVFTPPLPPSSAFPSLQQRQSFSRGHTHQPHPYAHSHHQHQASHPPDFLPTSISSTPSGVITPALGQVDSSGSGEEDLDQPRWSTKQVHALLESLSSPQAGNKQSPGPSHQSQASIASQPGAMSRHGSFSSVRGSIAHEASPEMEMAMQFSMGMPDQQQPQQQQQAHALQQQQVYTPQGQPQYQQQQTQPQQQLQRVAPKSTAVAMGAHVCHWQNCHTAFKTVQDLFTHIGQDHLSGMQQTSSAGSSSSTGNAYAAGQEQQAQEMAMQMWNAAGMANGGGMGFPQQASAMSPAVSSSEAGGVGAGLMACLWDDCLPSNAFATSSAQAAMVPASSSSSNPFTDMGCQGTHNHAKETQLDSAEALLKHLLESHLAGTVDQSGLSGAWLDGLTAPGTIPPPQSATSSESKPVLEAMLGTSTSSLIRGPIRPVISSSHTQTAAVRENKVHKCCWAGCSAVFSDDTALTEHLSKDHVGSNKSSYECLWAGCEKCEETACNDCGTGSAEKCLRGRQFASRQKIMRHLQSHTGHRPFLCPLCQQSFSEQATLQAHLRRHANEKPFKCDHPGCSKAFSVMASLTIHKRVHEGDKKHKCKHCDKAFVEVSNLTKHIRTHTGEKPFACTHPGCNKCFTRPDQMKRHLLTHSKKPARVEAASDATSEEGMSVDD